MRYLIKLDKKGVPVPGSLVYNTSYPQKGRWMEVETLDKDEEGHCIQPPKPYNYFQKVKYYYLVDECCNPIAGSNVNAYCLPHPGNYFEFFPTCLLRQECPPSLEIHVTINGEIICYGGTTTYSVTASGGYPPYVGINTYTVSTGTYTATITDSHGTTVSTQVVIPPSITSQIITSILQHTDIDCFGNNNGSFTIGASGGTAPYQYAITAIDSIPVINPIYQSSPAFANLSQAEYQVTVMDDNECIAITSVEIYEPAVLEVSLNSTDVLCYGQSTGTITTTVTGGVAPYRYVWSGGSLASNAQNQNTLPAGTYNVLVIDKNGCQATAQATITQPPQLVLSGSVTNVTCYGDDDGSINLSVTGGVAPYEYLWSNGAATEDLTALVPGRYKVTVTDANGCIKTLNFSVTQPAQLIASESHVLPLCYGDTNGSITLLVGGGVTPYTYAWTGPSVNPTSQNQTGLGSGLYSVTITDDNGCQVSITNIDLEITPIVATVNFVLTDPNTGEGTISVDGASGGTAPYEYSLDGGPYQSSNTFTNVFPGDHTIIVKDFNNCQQPFTITIPPPCFCYNIALTSGLRGRVNYTSCDGDDKANEPIDGNSGIREVNVCAQEGTVTFSSTEGATASITGGSVLCTGNLDCQPPVCECYQVNDLLGCTFEYTQCDGTVVPVTGGYICAQVGSITPTSPCIAPGGYQFFTALGGTCTADGDCIPSCECYDLDATNGSKIGIEFIDCNGTQRSVNPGDRIAACILGIITLGTGCTATPIVGGDCSIGGVCELPPPPIVPQRCVIAPSNIINPGSGLPYGTNSTAYQINSNYIDGYTYTYQLTTMVLDGTEYASGQTLSFVALAGLSIGLGLDGVTPYVMNVSDWLTSIASGTGFEFHDAMRVIDTPDSSSTYFIQVLYSGIYYTYTEEGFGFSYVAGTPPSFLYQTRSCSPL